MKRFLACSHLFMACIVACALAAGAQNASAPQTHGITTANIDPSVKPGDDFYHYANGEWIKRTEIPPDRADIDVFSKLSDLSNKRTSDLIEQGIYTFEVDRTANKVQIREAVEKIFSVGVAA